MTLTDEQRERIRRNRERALEIRRARKNQRPPDDSEAPANKHLKAGPTRDVTTATTAAAPDADADAGGRPDPGAGAGAAQRDRNDRAVEEAEAGTEVILEEFEMNAPPTVSKGEAARMYCLPEGTLQVCSYVERANPRNRSFAPMKLYDRGEIRRRARERYGGMDGLIAERERREQKRFERTLEETKDVFKKK